MVRLLSFKDLGLDILVEMKVRSIPTAPIHLPGQRGSFA